MPNGVIHTNDYNEDREEDLRIKIGKKTKQRRKKRWKNRGGSEIVV